MDIRDIYIMIGDNMRYFRFQNSKYGYLTQEKLANISQVSISIIRGIEAKREKIIISLSVLNSIARALDIPLYQFFIRHRKLK